jgi:hypothetical protein
VQTTGDPPNAQSHGQKSGSFSEEKEPKRILWIWTKGVRNSRLAHKKRFCAGSGATADIANLGAVMARI